MSFKYRLKNKNLKKLNLKYMFLNSANIYSTFHEKMGKNSLKNL